MSGRFEGRRALVTGASRGIGVGIAKRLASEGAHVAVVARSLVDTDAIGGSLERTAEALRAYGHRVGVITTDLADAEARATIVEQATAALGGPPEIVVNNAAAAIYAPLADFPLRRRRMTFEVNVHAPLDVAQAALPAMLAAGEGWIVNLSSGSARPPAGPPYGESILGSTIGVYAASKAALNRMTLALAQEVYGSGVRVNTVEPRNAVLSEGAAVLIGEKIRADQVESLDEMVEAATWLCQCPAEHTGRLDVSLDLLEEIRRA